MNVSIWLRLLYFFNEEHACNLASNPGGEASSATLPWKHLGERLIEVAQITGMCRVAQRGAHRENILQCAKRGAMGIVIRIRVAHPFRVGRKHDHPEWAVPAFPSSQVMKTMPPCLYACELRIGGRFWASQVSCISLHRFGDMKL